MNSFLKSGSPVGDLFYSSIKNIPANFYMTWHYSGLYIIEIILFKPDGCYVLLLMNLPLLYEPKVKAAPWKICKEFYN